MDNYIVRLLWKIASEPLTWQDVAANFIGWFWFVTLIIGWRLTRMKFLAEILRSKKYEILVS